MKLSIISMIVTLFMALIYYLNGKELQTYISLLACLIIATIEHKFNQISMREKDEK